MEVFYFALSNIYPIVWISLGVAVAAVLWLLLPYRRLIDRVGKAVREQSEEGVQEGDAGAPVSILVYVQDNAAGLTAVLNDVFSQRYKAPYEVIIINDGGSEEVKDVFNLMAATHRNLLMTFIPDEAHNLSRRKLGVSLGIKSARYENILLLTAECRLVSEEWLALMAAPFAAGKEVVIGWAGFRGLKGGMNRFDEVAQGVTWLSASLAGRPYRGTGFNLGYTRTLFFSSKGFSKSLNLHNGDDDLFINSIATGANTATVLATGAQVEIDSHNPRKEFRNQRLAHIFTGRKLPVRQRLLMGAGTMVMWLWLAATVTGMVMSIPNLLPSCAFVALIPVALIPVVRSWRQTGRALGVKLPAVRLPRLIMTRCLRNARWYLRSGSASRRNYTWLQR